MIVLWALKQIRPGSVLCFNANDVFCNSITNCAISSLVVMKITKNYDIKAKAF